MLNIFDALITRNSLKNARLLVTAGILRIGLDFSIQHWFHPAPSVEVSQSS
jgi:hypothetical protein